MKRCACTLTSAAAIALLAGAAIAEPPGTIDLGTPTTGFGWSFPVAAGQVTWFKFTLKNAIDFNPRYLDILIAEGDPSVADLDLALYDAQGHLLKQDASEGQGPGGALSFGWYEPVRQLYGGCDPLTGQDGILAAGVYYLAVAAGPASFDDNFVASAGSSASGNGQLFFDAYMDGLIAFGLQQWAFGASETYNQAQHQLVVDLTPSPGEFRGVANIGQFDGLHLTNITLPTLPEDGNGAFRIDVGGDFDFDNTIEQLVTFSMRKASEGKKEARVGGYVGWNVGTYTVEVRAGGKLKKRLSGLAEGVVKYNSPRAQTIPGVDVIVKQKPPVVIITDTATNIVAGDVDLGSGDEIRIIMESTAPDSPIDAMRYLIGADGMADGQLVIGDESVLVGDGYLRLENAVVASAPTFGPMEIATLDPGQFSKAGISEQGMPPDKPKCQSLIELLLAAPEVDLQNGQSVRDSLDVRTADYGLEIADAMAVTATGGPASPPIMISAEADAAMAVEEWEITVWENGQVIGSSVTAGPFIGSVSSCAKARDWKVDKDGRVVLDCTWDEPQTMFVVSIGMVTADRMEIRPLGAAVPAIHTLRGSSAQLTSDTPYMTYKFPKPSLSVSTQAGGAVSTNISNARLDVDAAEQLVVTRLDPGQPAHLIRKFKKDYRGCSFMLDTSPSAAPSTHAMKKADGTPVVTVETTSAAGMLSVAFRNAPGVAHYTYQAYRGLALVGSGTVGAGSVIKLPNGLDGEGHGHAKWIEILSYTEAMPGAIELSGLPSEDPIQILGDGSSHIADRIVLTPVEAALDGPIASDEVILSPIGNPLIEVGGALPVAVTHQGESIHLGAIGSATVAPGDGGLRVTNIGGTGSDGVWAGVQEKGVQIYDEDFIPEAGIGEKGVQIEGDGFLSKLGAIATTRTGLIDAEGIGHPVSLTIAHDSGHHTLTADFSSRSTAFVNVIVRDGPDIVGDFTDVPAAAIGSMDIAPRSFAVRLDASSPKLQNGFKASGPRGAITINGTPVMGDSVEVGLPLFRSPIVSVDGLVLLLSNTGPVTITSVTATPSEPCPADFDRSGFADTDDYDAFVRTFEAGVQSADVDGTWFVDLEDFDFFVHVFEAGC